MNDQNPYQTPGETERQRPRGFTYRGGGCTTLFLLALVVLAGVVVSHTLVVEWNMWKARMKREREQNAAPIVSESK
jgi:hypothetical protein